MEIAQSYQVWRFHNRLFTRACTRAASVRPAARAPPPAIQPRRHPAHQEILADACLPLGSGRSIVTAQPDASIGAKIDFATAARDAGRCPLWVKSGNTRCEQM